MDVSPVKQAGMMFKSGDIKGARSVLQQAIKQNPADANAWVAMAFCSDNVQQKFDCLQHALQLNPSSQPARDALQKLMATQRFSGSVAETNVATQTMESLAPKPELHDVPDAIADLYPDDFERLVGAVFTVYGMKVQHTGDFGDHGIDLVVEDGEGSKCLVQCKRWKKNNQVGEPVLRDLYGAMASEKATEGAIFTTGTFTQQARDWAEGKPLQLCDGPQILELIRNAGSQKLVDLLNQLNAEAEDKESHRCPQCGGQLVLRTSHKGDHAGEAFWGCENYPKCHYIRKDRRAL
jgi:restriction system protein